MKYIYNITVNIQPDIHDIWMGKIQNQYVQDVLKSGCFTHAKVLRLPAQGEGEHTYSLQFISPDKEALKDFYRRYAPDIYKRIIRQYGEKILFFGTELEVLAEYDYKG